MGGSTSSASGKPIDRSDFEPKRLDLFWSFICERQSIWKRRFIDKQLPPWTRDRILRNNRFTNVYRELDPGTQYAISILENDIWPPSSKLFNLMFYRLTGEKETHRALGFIDPTTFDTDSLISKMHAIKRSGKPVFTAAYLVAPYTKEGSTDKITNIARMFSRIAAGMSGLWSGLSSARSAGEAYELMRNVPGFGNFLAYQVLVDLLYPLECYHQHPLLPFKHDDFVVPGPGALRGISMLLKPRSKPEPAAVVRWLRENQGAEFQRLMLDFPYLTGTNGKPIELTLANVQNCLCEYHKYVKIKEGTGRGRRVYVYSKAHGASK